MATELSAVINFWYEDNNKTIITVEQTSSKLANHEKIKRARTRFKNLLGDLAYKNSCNF